MIHNPHRFLIISMLVFLLLFTSCNLPNGQSQTPSPDAAAVITEAAMTVAAHLTQSAALTPSPTFTQVSTATQVNIPPTEAATPAPQQATNTPTPKADEGSSTLADSASFVDDITVPDDTGAAPGAVFEKVWRIKNIGTTTWTPAYSLVWVDGDKMGSPDSIPIPHEVRPDETVDISVKLTAPTTPGTHQTFFRLRNANNQFFKLDTSGDLWVKIIVGLGSTSTPNTETATPTVTPLP